MRGVGWAICYLNPHNGLLSNHWITMHETGNIAGFLPILVMDAWEHAFILDYKPSERGRYIDAFFSNIDWKAVDERLARRRCPQPPAGQHTLPMSENTDASNRQAPLTLPPPPKGRAR